MIRTPLILSGTAFIVMAAFGVASAVVPCTPDWIGGEQFPGVNGPVGASLVWDPDGAGPAPAVLVVAGDFTFAGVTAAERIATWDGVTWSNPFGSGLDGMVHALAVYNGNLVAAGEFMNAGGASAPSIARWDGQAWQPLGSGLDGPVYALAVYNDRLYAGGVFTSAGGVAASQIAAWNGSSWSAVGTSGVDNIVYALAAFNGSLYAGGLFSFADSVASPGIARWDDSAGAWSAVGSGVGPADVRSLLVDGGQLYATGGFTNAGGLTAYGVARWSGSAWSEAGLGLYKRTCIRYSCANHPYRGRLLAQFGGRIYAAIDTGGGSPTLFKFNGTSWTAAGGFAATSVEPWPITTLTSFNGELYIGGNFGSANAPQYIARFNGTQWGTLGASMDGPIVSLTPFNNGLVATGGFTQIEGAPMSHVALWDGAAWHALGDGISQYTSGAAVVNGELYAAAWPGGIVHWDGTTWTTLYGAGAFSGPPAVGVWNGQVIAGAPYAGFGATGEESDPSAVAAWDGSAWVPLGTFGGVFVGPSAFATLNGALYAAGWTGTSSSPVGRYTGGSEWGVAGSTTLGTYSTAVVNHNGAIYATLAPGDGTGVVAELVGSNWQQLGGVFDVVPTALASVNGSLYAVGTFTVAGTVSCNGIAFWDGSAWQPLGSGAVGAVQAVAGLNGMVAAGGAFTSMGGKGWSSFAVYGCPPQVPGDFDGNGYVDQTDLAVLTACSTGPTVLYAASQLPPGCMMTPDAQGYIAADLDHDGDVDMNDFGIFQRCYNGPNRLADPNCAK